MARTPKYGTAEAARSRSLFPTHLSSTWRQEEGRMVNKGKLPTTSQRGSSSMRMGASLIDDHGAIYPLEPEVIVQEGGRANRQGAVEESRNQFNLANLSIVPSPSPASG